MKLLLALLLLAGELGAACAAGSISFWLAPGQTDVTDPCGGYTASKVGTPASSTAYCSGNTMYGPYSGSGSRYDAPAGFKTAWETAAPTSSIEYYLYLTSTATDSITFRWTDAAAVWEHHLTAATPAAIEYRRFAGGWSGVSSGAILSTGVCYLISSTSNGTTMKIYVDNVEKASSAITAPSGTVTEFSFGGEDGGACLNGGLIYGFRTSNIVRTSFPTVDPAFEDDDPCSNQVPGCVE